MIEVKREIGSLSVKGHAHYAEPGKDIVCAGVSTLVQTLLASLAALTTDQIQYDIKPGLVDIKHEMLSEGAQALFDSFFIGINLIASEYPEYVRVE